MKIVEELEAGNHYGVTYCTNNKGEAPENRACFSFLITYTKKILYIKIVQDYLGDENANNVCEIINKITPCSYNKETKIIKYTIIKGKSPDDRYNRNIFLLNFIRNLWHKPYASNYDNELFFNFDENLKDPVEILTTSHQKACEKVKHSPGHSNVNPNCKIKTLKQFKEHDFSTKLNNQVFTETRNFLTT